MTARSDMDASAPERSLQLEYADGELIRSATTVAGPTQTNDLIPCKVINISLRAGFCCGPCLREVIAMTNLCPSQRLARNSRWRRFGARQSNCCYRRTLRLRR